ncbi:MAG: hypothetical protein ACTJH7_10090 [Alcaligenes sp.]
MTGRFGNEYLAESVGYADGQAKGIAIGRQAGYNQGWNEAIAKCNPMIEERDREIARLTSEIYKGNDYIKELRAALEKSQHVSGLYHKDRDELVVLHRQEKAQRERLEYMIEQARRHGVNIEDFNR